VVVPGAWELLRSLSGASQERPNWKAEAAKMEDEQHKATNLKIKPAKSADRTRKMEDLNMTEAANVVKLSLWEAFTQFLGC
jgi:hypothetical protein